MNIRVNFLLCKAEWFLNSRSEAIGPARFAVSPNAQWKSGKWMKMAEDSTFARWTYAHYFDFVRDKDKKNVIVKCNLCINPRELSTSRNSTSNLKKHLERCHATTPLTEKRKKTEDESDKPKQQKLSFSRSAIMPLDLEKSEDLWQSMSSRTCYHCQRWNLLLSGS